MKQKVPQLALLCGLPRSGKTTWAKAREREGWVRVCPDEIRLALHGTAFIPEAEPHVWALAETMARALLLGGREVLIDATNTTRDQRAKWVKLAHAVGVWTPDIYWINTPYHLCLARNTAIGAVPVAVIERMHTQFEQPTRHEGRVLIPVDGVGFLIPRDPEYEREVDLFGLAHWALSYLKN